MRKNNFSVDLIVEAMPKPLQASDGNFSIGQNSVFLVIDEIYNEPHMKGAQLGRSRPDG
jgi:hypothetical protein